MVEASKSPSTHQLLFVCLFLSAAFNVCLFVLSCNKVHINFLSLARLHWPYVRYQQCSCASGEGVGAGQG